MDLLLKLFKSLANEKRVKIVKTLLDYKEMTLDSIVEELDLPYKTVARNLKILEKSGLVKSRIWNGIAYYSLDENPEFYYNRTLIEIIRVYFKEKKGE